MAHWRSTLPASAMLDVAYEDVVDDLEGQARRLIDYCGVPWDDRCISFHQRPGWTSQPVLSRFANPFSQLAAALAPVRGWLGPLLGELGDLIPGYAQNRACERADGDS